MLNYITRQLTTPERWPFWIERPFLSLLFPGGSANTDCGDAKFDRHR
jgi:hypothetical protein